jgi:hypothetical protein
VLSIYRTACSIAMGFGSCAGKLAARCVRYRHLELELPHAPVADVESDGSNNRIV